MHPEVNPLLESIKRDPQRALEIVRLVVETRKVLDEGGDIAPVLRLCAELERIGIKV